MISPDDLDTDKALADQLFNVFANAWVSGFSSAFVNAAQRAGHPEATLKTLGTEAEHHGQHAMRHLTEDPIAMHTVMESIRHVLGGCKAGEQPYRGIAEVHHRGRPIQDGS